MVVTVWDLEVRIADFNQDCSPCRRRGDTLTGSDSTESAYEEQLLGEGDVDTINCNDGDDFADGGAGDDSINGGGGEDLLKGGTGHDTIRGGPNDDIIHGDAGSDNLDGDGDDDHLYGGTAVVTPVQELRGGSGDDHLFGGPNFERLYGEGDEDTLISAGGGSEMYGGSHKDVLEGDSGSNLMDGGGGQRHDPRSGW